MKKATVINDVMSSHAPILLMPTSSDGRSVGFLSDLVNFYRYTYWLSCDYDQMSSFPMIFAERIFGRGEEFQKIMQFKHCEFEYEKDNIIIGKVLEKIASNAADSLLIIDSLEQFNDKTFDSQLEFLLKKCPKNLKVVLVSKRFIDLNYNNLDVCPKLLDPPDAEEGKGSFDFSVLSSEQKAFLYEVCALGDAELEFLERIRPDAKTILDAVSRISPEFVMKKGSRYHFSPDMRECLPAFPSDDKALLHRYIYYCLEKEYPIIALDYALKNGFFDLLDDVVDALLVGGNKSFAISEYFRAHGDRDLDESRCDGNRKKLLLAASRSVHRDVKRMASLTDEIIATSEKNGDVERMAQYVKFLSFVQAGQYRAALDYTRDLLNERIKKEEDFFLWGVVLCRLPGVIKQCDAEVDEKSFYRVEKALLKEENREQFWYTQALQACAEVYFNMGNYSRAMALLDRIKERIPFYTIPYRLLEFYYYAGDMRLAYDVARQALRDSKFHDVEANLTEVYLLMAKASNYLNKQEESIKYVDYAVNSSEGNSPSKYNALAYKAMFCARLGKAAYGKDLVAVYERGFTGRNNKNEYMIYLALAYCSYCLEQYEDAEKYALRCGQKSHMESGARLLSRAIELDVKLHNGTLSYYEVEDLFIQCKTYGMTVIVVNYYDCFSPLFDYAKRSGIRMPNTMELMRSVRQKMDSSERQKSVTVRLFGDSYVGVNGKEIRWKTKKEKELFLLYAWKGASGLDRGYLLNSLWEDYLYESAVNNLKTTNFMVRKTLTEAGVPYQLKYANGKYYFTGEYSTDLDLFMHYREVIMETKQAHEKLELARKMYALYNGGFCLEINTPVFCDFREQLRKVLFQVYYNVTCDLIESGETTVVTRIIRQLESKNLGELYADQIEELKKKTEGIMV